MIKEAAIWHRLMLYSAACTRIVDGRADHAYLVFREARLAQVCPNWMELFCPIPTEEKIKRAKRRLTQMGKNKGIQFRKEKLWA